jgi:alkylhydroperoxidase/carboxymuconolactone decarboxylase family protein YurZ
MKMTPKENDEATARGLAMLSAVFGPTVRANVEAMPPSPQRQETVQHLLGEIWSRPQLSIRDRRLLVIGVTATLGSPNLIEALIAGAIANGELTDEEIDEIPLFLSFYAGWGKAGPILSGIAAARAAAQRNASTPGTDV